MTEPCLNNPCMMTFKTRYKSLSNKMLQTWMKLFHFNLTTSGCQTDNRVAFPFWMGQICSKAAETASSIYVRAQISTSRLLIWNTAMTVGLKHLHPCETSLQHSCLKTPLHQLHQMGEGFITDELNKSLTLLSTPEAKSIRVSTGFKVLFFPSLLTVQVNFIKRKTKPHADVQKWNRSNIFIINRAKPALSLQAFKARLHGALGSLT